MYEVNVRQLFSIRRLGRMGVKQKKLFTVILIFALVGRFFVPFVVNAQTPPPTDTPTPTVTQAPAPTDTPSITPSPTPTVTVTPSLTPILTPTLTPTVAVDSPTPTPTIDPSQPTPQVTGAINNASASASVDTSATPSASVSTDSPGNSGSSNGNGNNSNSSGNHGSSGGSSNQSSPHDPSITTGNATAATTGTNTVNTTAANSPVIYQTINLFIDSNGDINLSEPQSIASNILTGSNADNPTTNVLMTGVNNYASLANNVISTANSGNNVASGSGDLVINTGNADSLVSLTNTVNLTLIDSAIHIIVLNIYGVVNGNIVLPTVNGSTSCTSCSITTLATNNNATVVNTVASAANTGSNTTTNASGSAQIATGKANSAVNIFNLINMLLYGVNYQALYVNNFGTWNGSFLGWGNIASLQGGQNLSATSITTAGSNATCTMCAQYANIKNTANVSNTVVSSANTGNNSTNGGGNASITTGNAASFVAITNLINSIFIKSGVYLGFINIFGTLNGNIGDAGSLAQQIPTPAPSQDTVTTDTSDGITHREDGGNLTLSSSNNVGAFVYPGDTVTVFAKARNNGSGRVYGAVLHLSMIQGTNSQDVADFNLGDIPTGEGVQLSTGLVLAKTARSGNYIIHATVTGTTGDENKGLSASSDSTFAISPLFTPIDNTLVVKAPVTLPQHGVLGTHTKESRSAAQTQLYLMLVIIVFAYLGIRAARDYKQLGMLFSKSISMKDKLHTVRLFLL
ncbi:MAG TPA: hypothetical protein VGT05_04675 [Patescibacteria group bacterium]|nr:hypothetical protein [Patescibacteria group bacterium]